jgi:hypothetical protein
MLKRSAISASMSRQAPSLLLMPAAQIPCLRGDRSAIPANKMIIVPTVVVQRNNVDDYIKKLDQLLGK